MIQQKLCRIDLYGIVFFIVPSGGGKILLIFPGLLRAGCNRYIAFRLGISRLDIVRQQILDKQPGSQDDVAVILDIISG